MKLITKITLFLILCSSSAVSFANETGYEIELIIFEDAKSRYIHAEQWSYNDMLNNVREEGVVKTPDKDPEYTELDWSSAKLGTNLDRILNNPNYKVLIKKRWKQTGLNPEESFNLSINSQTTNDIVNTQSTDIITTQELTSYITGNVKLIMSRYLHFAVNLQYFKPGLDEVYNTTYKSYPVVAERRMKSKEIHYIDHPLVGVIVLATPYKIEEEKPANKPAKYIKTQ